MRRALSAAFFLLSVIVQQACQRDEATAPHARGPHAQVAATATVGQRIAFASNRDGLVAIYLMNADGSAQTRLPNSAPQDQHPAWSPDGHHIAFASRRDGHYEIYITLPDGSAPTRLTTTANVVANLKPSWSADGRRIVFASDSGDRHIDVMNDDGSGVTQLTHPSGIVPRDDDPTWSPDGSQITFSRVVGLNSEIYVMNADGSALTQLTSDPAQDGQPAWSPDGSKIAFTSDRDGNLHLYVMNPDGSGVTQLTSGAFWDDEAAWSPDGSKIAFESNRDGNYEIYVMNADGSAPTRLTNNPADDVHPTWSPAMAVDQRLTFLTQPPESVEVNAVISPAVRVAVTDSLGNPVVGATDSVTLTLSNNSTGATLGGTTTVAAVDGIATFADLQVDRVGRGYTLDATAALLGIARSTPFAVYAPARLVFVTEPPESVEVNVPISPPVRIAVADALGNPIPGATDTVTLAFGSNPSGATLLGATRVAAVDGIASFADLRVDRPANGLTLVATAPDRTGGTSAPFTVHVSFATVDAGGGHSCGVTTAGQGFCWGDNSWGQLGEGTLLAPDRPTPAPVAGGLSFAMISVGNRHSCGVTTTGEAYCWGFGSDGQLGNGSSQQLQAAPVPVAGGLRFTLISAGGSHTCGLAGDGRTYCWGDNFWGQLGNGTLESRQTVPVPVSSGLTFATISAGDSHTCGATDVGLAYCWGANRTGQLGDGTTVDRRVPAPVVGVVGFDRVDAGSAHSCGVASDGAAYCWGDNTNGQLGDGTTARRTTPVPIAGGFSFATLNAGSTHTCGLTTSGGAYCWGSNFSGQLGDGTTVTRLAPSSLAGGLSFTAIRAGAVHTCGMANGAGAYCWGSNASGKLGDGTRNGRLTPARVVQ